MVSTLLSMNIFTGRPSFMGARRAHKRHHAYILSYHRVQNLYQLFKNHDSTLMLSSIIFTYHPFQPSSISLLRVGNAFSISSPFDVTKLQKKKSLYLIDWQFSIPSVNGHVYSYPLPALWR